MRQLKGKVKESRKEKRERKQEFEDNRKNLYRIVVPTLVTICAVIIGIVYYKSRPFTLDEM